MLIRTMFVVIFLFVLPLWAGAADYYVQPGGTRITGESVPGDWSLPNCYGSIEAACSQADISDSVLLWDDGETPTIYLLTASTGIPAFLINMDGDGDYSNCIVEFSPGTNLTIRHNVAVTTIRGITFRNHPEGDGFQCIGLQNNTASRHTVNIEKCCFLNNKGKNVANGKGSCISVSDSNIGGIDLFVRDSIFNSNEAKYGGALYLNGNITCNIISSVFNDNKAGVLSGNNGKGGALAFSGEHIGHLSITDSTFDGNLSGSQGGAMFLKDLVSVNLSGTHIVKNKSGLDDTSHSDGGAGVQFRRSAAGIDSTFTMSNCTVSQNIWDGDIEDATDSMDGGGIHVRSGGPDDRTLVTINDTLFNGNFAKQGAGLYVGRYCSGTISRCTFINNTAMRNGGASYKGGINPDCLGETATYKSCVFIGNKAGFDQNGDPVPESYVGKGGALMTRYFPRIVAENCGFMDNKAKYKGDSFYHWSEGNDFNSDQQRCSLVNSTFWGTGTNAEIESQRPYGFTEISNCTFSDDDLVDGGVIPTGLIVLTGNPFIGLTIANHGKLIISPPSGKYLTKQQFDLSLILDEETHGLTVTGAYATFDGADVSAFIKNCVIPGTLVTGSQTFRCAGITGDSLGTGSHVFSLLIDLSDGSSASSTVVWQVLENLE